MNQSILFSKVLLSLVFGMLVNSRRLYLEYSLLLHHWCSKLVILICNAELTCEATHRSESSFSKYFFKSDSLFLILAKVESNYLFRQSRAKLSILSFGNFFKATFARFGNESISYINDNLCMYYKRLWRKCKTLQMNKIIHSFSVMNGSIRLKTVKNVEPTSLLILEIFL